ncbi:MAG: prolyl oligopeptidase family serine peptidase [Bacteroidales bacterium]|nr:prolyl oligopeptidase family serine peptidase [Bacteroidales bacterium]
MIKRVVLSVLVLTAALTAVSQTTKKSMTIEDVLKWNRITEKEISPDGKFVAVKLEPWKGATTVKLYDNRGKELLSADSSSSLTFDKSSEYLLFKRGSDKKSSLIVYNLKSGVRAEKEGVKEFSLPKGYSSEVIYRLSDSTLVIETLKGGSKISLGKVNDFKIAKEGTGILYVSEGNILLHKQGQSNPDTVMKKAPKGVKTYISDKGDLAAFIASGNLFLYDNRQKAESVAKGVSDKRDVVISPDGTKIYYGIAPEAPKRDTTISKEDFPQVHIWHWNEGKQFTQQVVDKKRDSERSFLYVYNTKTGESSQISNENITETRLVNKGDSDFVVAISDNRYAIERMWEGRSKVDIYIVNTVLQRASMLKEGATGQPRISPGGKFIYWYSGPDSAWFAVSPETMEVKQITSPKSIQAYDHENDVPDWPSSYSSAGWSTGDKYFLVYDRYDIWRVDPLAKEAPLNLTLNGKVKNITYRYSSVNDSEEIDLKKSIILTGFDNTTKENSYFSFVPEKGKEPVLLYEGKAMLSDVSKAKDSDTFIFTRETFREFPDIWLSDSKFKKPVRITNANPQQSEFIWGDAQLISWISLDGHKMEGVLYKPENFDPSKKYPMIVNFYDKNSSALHSHRIPEAHRSTIDYHMYTSNGYIVLNTDIVYKEGYPGESAYNCIMPGISAVINMGFVDPARIGAQGHSWGGYQVAYLATRTNLFAAIESGAPVVNMFSAYGGIRWGTGLNRSFQYEHQQSRIGKTPWESPLRYIENSPIFTMDKVTTPILIMHNDQDGHVPWYQGIEYFVALKRLRKPVWMLNYTGEVHWPQKLKNKVDFQIRMMQFFDHYLKGKPMPEWMEKGLSAIELDYRMGY